MKETDPAPAGRLECTPSRWRHLDKRTTPTGEECEETNYVAERMNLLTPWHLPGQRPTRSLDRFPGSGVSIEDGAENSAGGTQRELTEVEKDPSPIAVIYEEKARSLNRCDVRHQQQGL